MAKQTVGLGSSANDGTGDTLRSGGTKINSNFNEIYAEFGDGSTLSNANTSGDILVADGTKFVNRTTSGDINISNTGAINLRGNELSVIQGSAPSSTTNKLYNVGGTLYWNGNTIGVAGGGDSSTFTVAGDSGSSQSIADGNTLIVLTSNFIAGLGAPFNVYARALRGISTSNLGVNFLQQPQFNSKAFNTPPKPASASAIIGAKKSNFGSPFVFIHSI